ncbi:MAG: hypothetical protein AB2800_20360 [Candidatus Thiodiazotropha endolucinida]
MDGRITPPGLGKAGDHGAGELRNLDSNYSTPASLEVKNSFKHCAVCGSRFTPERHNHSLCDQCWSYDQVGRAIESIRHLMREVAA